MSYLKRYDIKKWSHTVPFFIYTKQGDTDV